jgi:WD40 repeat protein
MKGHRQPPLAIAFSPDGTQVVTSSDEKLVHVWPVHSEAKPQRIDIREGGARSITFSEDGRWLAAASDRSLTIWDASHLERARQVDIPEGRHIVAFTPAGLCVVASATFRTLRLWEATTGQELAVLDTDVRVEEMTMTPAGDRLMVADTNGNLRIWEVRVPDAASLRARSTLPADFAEAPAQPEPAADSESEGNRLGIFHHVVDLFR